MNSAAAARCGCDPAEGVFFGCPSVEGGPPFVGTWGERELPRNKFFCSCAVSGCLLRGVCSCAGQILSLVRRVGMLSPRRAFSRGGKFFCSYAVSGGFRRGERSCAGQIPSPVRRVGRPSPRGAFLRGQIPSPVRRVGMPSPWGVFLRGANSFAFAPCRDAFAEENLLARGKSFRSCAVSGGLRRGACSCAGQILPTTPRHRKTVARHRKSTPRCASTCGRGGLNARPRRAKRPPCPSPKSAPPAAAAPLPRRHPPRRGHGRGAPYTARVQHRAARVLSSSASARSAARRSWCVSSSRRSFIYCGRFDTMASADRAP